MLHPIRESLAPSGFCCGDNSHFPVAGGHLRKEGKEGEEGEEGEEGFGIT